MLAFARYTRNNENTASVSHCEIREYLYHCNGRFSSKTKTERVPLGPRKNVFAVSPLKPACVYVAINFTTLNDRINAIFAFSIKLDHFNHSVGQRKCIKNGNTVRITRIIHFACYSRGEIRVINYAVLSCFVFMKRIEKPRRAPMQKRLNTDRIIPTKFRTLRIDFFLPLAELIRTSVLR